MKVVFFVQGMHVAASRYRVLQYLPFFKAQNIDTDVLEFPRNIPGWTSVVEHLKSADVLFVQRKRLPRSILLLLRRMKKKIIYDFDDAVMFNVLGGDDIVTAHGIKCK